MSENVGYPENPIEEYAEKMESSNTNTRQNVLTAIRQFSEHYDGNVLSAEPSGVLAWLSELDNDGYAASTIRQKQMSLRTFYNVYMDGETDEGVFFADCLSENPARFDVQKMLDIDSTKAEKQKYADKDGVIYLKPSEVEALKEAVPKPKIRNTLIIKIAVQTGARVSELVNLKVSDIDRDNGIVKIDDTKNDQYRHVPYQNLSPELSLWLDRGYRDRFSAADDSEYLLIGEQSENNKEPHISARWVGEMVRETAHEAGIQKEIGTTIDGNTKRKVTPHALRSTFCVQIFKQSDVSVPTVMELTGHSRIATVEEYAKVAREDAVESLQSVDIDFGA